MKTDWSNPKSKVTEHFTVHEACWLPRAGMLYLPTPKEQANLVRTFELMEKVRELVQSAISVHCAIRPFAYNVVVGGAKNSAHIEGLACDFDVPGTDCDDLRKLLIGKLDEWGARCEDLPGSSWVHLDLRQPPPGGKRFFKP